jgi:indolepyruvate decarboxylase
MGYGAEGRQVERHTVVKTVIEHVLGRLHEIGVADIFGVPGDFAFPVNDAICNDPDIRWIGCCNELNAAYAADGYARLNGVGALCTTYGVGELSALAGIAGSYAEHLPIFHLVGTPNMTAQAGRAIIHHTLGNGEYNLFARMSEPVVCAHAIMTPQNAAAETERLIAAALYHRRPVYMAFPGDLALQPVLTVEKPLQPAVSDAQSLAACTDAIATTLGAAKRACILPGILVDRAGLRAEMQALVDASGLPFATLVMDKTVLDEQQPAYAGMYDGTLMDEDVRVFVETCDAVITVGTLMTDLSTGAFTTRLDPAKTIAIGHHHTSLGGRTYAHVEMADVLSALALGLPKRDFPGIAVSEPMPLAGSGNDPITADALYPRWEAFLREDDIVIAETGTASMGLAFAQMPSGATFHNQTLWGSIGWATPAAFGAAVAAPERRTILVTGEGSHQFTVQELSQFGRMKLRPIVFVLNNNGYLIERLLCKDPAIAYNDVAQWNYAELPHAFGCDDWFVARVTTCEQLDSALEEAARSTTGAYIEVVTGAYEAPPMAAKLGVSLRNLYKKSG